MYWKEGEGKGVDKGGGLVLERREIGRLWVVLVRVSSMVVCLVLERGRGKKLIRGSLVFERGRRKERKG